MDPFEHLETDSVVDLQVSVAEGDVSAGVEVTGESHAIGSIAGSSVGTFQEAEAGRLEPTPRDIAGAERPSHRTLWTPWGSNLGSIMKASTTLCVGNPIPLLHHLYNFYTLVACGCPRLASRQENGVSCRVHQSFTRSHGLRHCACSFRLRQGDH